MNLVLLSAAFPLVLACTPLVSAAASSHHSPHAVVRSYEIHIVPTTMQADAVASEDGPDLWSARGFDLKTLISRVYNVDPRRVDFPDLDAANARYDVTLSFHRDQSEEAVRRLLQQALQKRFGLTVTSESRSMDVYVLSAPHGPGPALHPHLSRSSTSLRNLQSAEQLQEFTFEGLICSGVISGSIKASRGTISEFRRDLELQIDRPILNETGLNGSFDFQIESYRNQQELFDLMRDQLGLLLIPSQRQITVLTVRSA